MTSEVKAPAGREIFNIASSVDTAAQRWGDRVALYHYDTGRTITYQEVSKMSSRVGNALRASGVEIENRVAILMDDSPEWVYALIGGLKIGAVITPLNPLLSEADYEFFLSDSRAKAIFVGANYYDKIKNILSSLPYLKRVIVCDGNVESQDSRVISWDDFLKGASDKLEIEPTFATDLALFAYTSGSTGRPRALMHCHHIMFRLSELFAIYGFQEGDVQFHIAKLYFLTSLGMLLGAFKEGYAIVLLSGRPLPMTLLEIIAKYRPNFISGPPTIYTRMVEAAKEAPHLRDMSSIRYIFSAGEALPTEVFQRFKETFGKPIYNCWGAQEIAAAPLGWVCGEEVPAEKIGSVGRLVQPGAEVKIVDDQGGEVPDGVAGELMVKIDSHLVGYWHEPDGAARKFVEGWYKPGDSFMRDKEGYYWYRGRLDDMVKVGGRQIFPVEVEETIARHPAVLENGVIPVANEAGLTELQAFVVLKKGFSPSPELAAEIQNFVKEELAPFKRPQRVEFIAELPKTGTGKIQRYRLRELAQGQKRA
ncbi:MAG: benzoate-CoA ligase family protein [Chloroflexi bacterium]|nr:benzoate-CoA ligase family protein [Chloroflexota bacterium]